MIRTVESGCSGDSETADGVKRWELEHMMMSNHVAGIVLQGRRSKCKCQRFVGKCWSSHLTEPWSVVCDGIPVWQVPRLWRNVETTC